MSEGSAAEAVHVVMPGDVDRLSVASGGNVYDRRVCEGLARTRPVHELPVSGSWPRPDGTARGDLAAALAGVPDGATVLMDGLVACGVPEVVVPEAGRLRLVILVHLPLADETQPPGAPPPDDLDVRERETLRASHAVVTTGRRTAGRLIEHHGLDAARVHVAPPGTDPAPLAPGTEDGTRLLCVASLTPRKGHDLLVEALARVGGHGWELTCVGPLRRDLDQVARLRALIERHGLDDRIHLAGPRTGERLDAAYAAADLLVLASRAETYGMVVTEALARGLPVLATEVGGVPEALGRTAGGEPPGLLVPPEDPDALAGALRRWLGEPDLRRRLRKLAAERRDTLPSWDDTTRALTGVLNGLDRVAP
ncbi:glycosyltransferase family 4 protein [Actinomadura sp. SCN-SB]|uniref:glycosyltransferase family 4 protein n=1 Tax=Actinomadura sp. SCN-SB TaxID=3373092 RepID=UPI0037521D36